MLSCSLLIWYDYSIIVHKIPNQQYTLPRALDTLALISLDNIYFKTIEKQYQYYTNHTYCALIILESCCLA